ncbi:glycosyltransferase family 2 protein [Enterococcus sp. DIV0800]|uniref:glycosyltransferase family 2 protein n=1 Tax=unclassified Enterococcus TaxID=2608891 RepID=UPI003D3010B6
MYKVSVIITTHNRLPMLKKAIECVKNQTYPEIELNIINDNSNDGTREYLEKIKDSSINIKHLYGENSKGGNHARNVGIDMSSGDFIAFLDDDDIWNNQKVEKQIEIFGKDSSVGLVYCGYERLTDDRLSTKVLPNPLFRGNIGLNVFSNIFSITSCLMVKKSLLKKIGGFDENLSHWQEYDLLVRISQISKIDYVNECLVKIIVIRSDKNRLSNQVDRWIESVEYFNKKHKSLIDQLNKNGLIKKEIIFYLDGASRYAAIGNKKMHKKYMKFVWKKTKKTHYFVRYIFNLDNYQIEKIRSFLQKNNIDIEKIKRI